MDAGNGTAETQPRHAKAILTGSPEAAGQDLCALLYAGRLVCVWSATISRTDREDRSR